jgi:crotonobetainyl-CoA:carnitine CoA-transferase CaiB-like acyl-CoA transferase
VIYDDLRVLDRSSSLAGAYCAKLLADLGADVVRLEPRDGDPQRADGLDGAHWSYLRTSQRSITTADPRWESGADIVVQDASLESAGLVTVAISPLGLDGPDSHLNTMTLTEEVLQARSGALASHGHMTHPPLPIAGRIGEYVTGAMAALAALTVWPRAARRGVAETVDVSMLEAMQLTMLTMPTLFANFPGGRKTAFRFVMIPGNEPCRDGNFVGITTNTLAQWKALLDAAGRRDLVDDTELHTMIGRFMRAADVHAALHAWTLAHTADEIEAACIEHRVPVAVVGNGKLLLEFEHLAVREVFVEQPGADFVRPRAPIRLHGVEARRLDPAPTIGAHDAAVPWTARTRSGSADVGGERPLAGVRVLDFTAFWAGPAATAWLAAMGADVIKIESVQRPDGMRMSGTTHHGHADALECSPLYHASNLNKRGITLDLSRPAGVDIAKRLIATCDVVAENFTPRVMEEFGLDYDAVRAIRPDVVMLRLPAFGLTGPWRDRPGFAQTMEQLSGMAWATGYEGGPPIIAGGVVDPMVGAHASLAIVAALEHRRRTGEGQLVEVPMVEVAVATTADQVIRYQLRGEIGDRHGTPGVYRCAGDDDWIAIDTALDPISASDRAEWCATRTNVDAARELLAAAVPAFAAIPGYAALDDPQLIARDYFEPVAHPVAGEQQFPRWPMRLSGGPARFWTEPAPTLGQHNDDVLIGELGLSRDEVQQLRDDHIIGETPIAPR